MALWFKLNLYQTATNADADAGVESHIPTAAIATTALDPDHAPSSLPSTSSSSRLLKAKTTTTPGHSSQHISLTPNGIKADVAGGDAYSILRDHIGWWYQLIYVNLGNLLRYLCSGHADATDAQRLKQFQRLSSSSSNKRHPKYVLGHEEPDCTSGGGSSGMGVDKGVREWERLIAPLKGRGTKIGSPSMCSECSIEYLYGKMKIYLFSEQVVETWLIESASKISTPWDFTAIHVNKSSLNDVKRDIVSDVICFRKNPAVIVIVACFQDHYWKTYGQPIWVTELACVNGASGLCSFSSGRY